MENKYDYEFRKSMRRVLYALCLECGETEGKEIFEWYCRRYNVTIADEAPETVLNEVFG